MSWGEIKLFLLIFCENETIIFSPVTGMACFIWEFFQPACRDLGIARRDLGKRASPPSHINSMSFFTKNVWRAKISVKRASPLTGLARLHINRPLILETSWVSDRSMLGLKTWLSFYFHASSWFLMLFSKEKQLRAIVFSLKCRWNKMSSKNWQTL